MKQRGLTIAQRRVIQEGLEKKARRVKTVKPQSVSVREWLSQLWKRIQH